MRKLDIYFSSAFSLCLFFPTHIPTYALEVYALYIIIDLALDKVTLKGARINLRRFPAELSTLLIFFLINLLSTILSDRTEGSWHQIEKRLSFILIPVMIVIRKDQFSTFVIQRILTFFVFGAFTATLLNFFRAIYRSVSWVNGEFVFNASVENHRSFTEGILFGGNFFFYEEYSSFMHPTYFGLYILYSVFILFVFLKKAQVNTKHRTLIALLIIWFLLNIFVLSSRAVFLSTLLFLPVAFLAFVDRLKSKSRLILIPLLLVLFSTIIFFNPRSSDLWKNLDAFQATPRILILKAGSKVIEANFPSGAGVVDLDYEMVDAYKEMGFDEGVTQKYNLHNQYMETLAGSGLPGILSLLLMITALTKKGINEKNSMLLGLVVLLAFNFLFESILNVYSGIVFFCFMSSLLILYKPNQEIRTQQ